MVSRPIHAGLEGRGVEWESCASATIAGRLSDSQVSTGSLLITKGTPAREQVFYTGRY